MNTSDFDPRLHQQLGELLAEVRNLRDAFRQSEIKSDTSRSQMHGRLDLLVDRVGKVEGTVAAVQEDISEMRPVTDDVRRWKLMGLGALGIVGIGASALTFILTKFGTAAMAWVTGR